MLLSTMHSGDHPNARLTLCTQVHFRKEHSEGPPDFVASRKRQILGVLPAFGQSSRQIVSRGNPVLDGGSNALWSLRPKIALRASHFRLLAIVSYCRLHNASTFGSRLATRAHVKRPTMVANVEKPMFQAQSEIMAVCGFHAGRRLVGSWILDLEPSVNKNVVPAASRAESLELRAIGPSVQDTLILVWTLQ
jgi:hypothetical protein